MPVLLLTTTGRTSGQPRTTPVSLQIDTEVEQPRMWIAWSGLVLIVFGIGIRLREVIVRARKR
jgi:hypothetical protein